MKTRIFLVALAVLVMAAPVLGASVTTTKFTKQLPDSGSTGDSLDTAADTSVAVYIPRGTTSLIVFAASDSTSRYTTQISPDGTYWFTIDEDSTLAAGAASASADFGTIYANMQLRVIQEQITGACPFGATWLNLGK